MNPYSQPLPFNQNERNACHNSVKTATTVKPTTTAAKATSKLGPNASASLSTIEEEETSPTIRRILEKTGCSSRQELLAMRAAQEQQGSKSTTNRNGSNSTTNRNKSMAATNGAKAATNGTKVSKSTNGSKATNGSKTTNPKKKARSKYFCLTTFDTKIPSLIQSKGSKATKTNTNRSKSTDANTNGSKSANGSKRSHGPSSATLDSIVFVCHSMIPKAFYYMCFTHTSNHISIQILLLSFSQFLHHFEL